MFVFAPIHIMTTKEHTRGLRFRQMTVYIFITREITGTKIGLGNPTHALHRLMITVLLLNISRYSDLTMITQSISVILKLFSMKKTENIILLSVLRQKNKRNA